MIFEKALKTSITDKEIHDKEAKELRRIHNHYLDKRSEIMKTSFKVKVIFGDIISKDNNSQDQRIFLKFFSEKIVGISFLV